MVKGKKSWVLTLWKPSFSFTTFWGIYNSTMNPVGFFLFVKSCRSGPNMLSLQHSGQIVRNRRNINSTSICKAALGVFMLDIIWFCTNLAISYIPTQYYSLFQLLFTSSFNQLLALLLLNDYFGVPNDCPDKLWFLQKCIVSSLWNV